MNIYKKQGLFALLILSASLFTGNAIAMDYGRIDLVADMNEALEEEIDDLRLELQFFVDEENEMRDENITSLSDNEESERTLFSIDEEVRELLAESRQEQAEVRADIDLFQSLIDFEPYKEKNE